MKKHLKWTLSFVALALLLGLTLSLGAFAAGTDEPCVNCAGEGCEACADAPADCQGCGLPECEACGALMEQNAKIVNQPEAGPASSTTQSDNSDAQVISGSDDGAVSSDVISNEDNSGDVVSDVTSEANSGDSSDITSGVISGADNSQLDNAGQGSSVVGNIQQSAQNLLDSIIVVDGEEGDEADGCTHACGEECELEDASECTHADCTEDACLAPVLMSGFALGAGLPAEDTLIVQYSAGFTGYGAPSTVTLNVADDYTLEDYFSGSVFGPYAMTKDYDNDNLGLTWGELPYYSFMGWATSDGTRYNVGDVLPEAAFTDGTCTLAAVWENTGMIYTDKDNNDKRMLTKVTIDPWYSLPAVSGDSWYDYSYKGQSALLPGEQLIVDMAVLNGYARDVEHLGIQVRWNYYFSDEIGSNQPLVQLFVPVSLEENYPLPGDLFVVLNADGSVKTTQMPGWRFEVVRDPTSSKKIMVYDGMSTEPAYTGAQHDYIAIWPTKNNSDDNLKIVYNRNYTPTVDFNTTAQTINKTSDHTARAYMFDMPQENGKRVTFLGWGTSPNGPVKYSAGTVISSATLQTLAGTTGTVNLYAIYNTTVTPTDPDTYSVTYVDPLNATSTTKTTPPTDSNEYEEGETVNVKFAPAIQREGLTFLGWSKTPGASTPTYKANGTKSFDMPDEDVTLYAVWAFDASKIEAEGIYRVYDGTSSEVTVKGTLPGDVVTYKYGAVSTTDEPSFTNANCPSATDDTGLIKVTITVERDGYTYTTETTVHIWRRPVNFTSGDVTKKWTGSPITSTATPQQPTPIANGTGLVAGHTMSETVSATGTDEGRYAFGWNNACVIKSGNVDVTNNYAVTYTIGNLIIEKEEDVVVSSKPASSSSAPTSSSKPASSSSAPTSSSKPASSSTPTVSSTPASSSTPPPVDPPVNPPASSSSSTSRRIISSRPSSSSSSSSTSQSESDWDNISGSISNSSSDPDVGPPVSGPASNSTSGGTGIVLNGNDGGDTGGDGGGQSPLLARLFGDPNPLAGSGRGASWSLFNLMVAIATFISAVVCFVGFFIARKRREEEEDTATAQQAQAAEVQYAEGNQQANEEPEKRDRKKGVFWRLLAIAMGIPATILFLLIEDITLPMVLFNKWSILHAIFLVVQILLIMAMRKSCQEKKKKEDDDQQQPYYPSEPSWQQA